MTKEYTFYDYIDADGDGSNVIRSWLNSEAKAAKAYFGELIHNLEVSSPPGAANSFWKRPYAAPMKYEWDGFWEFRKKAKKIQYRLLGQMRYRDVYLVAYGTHMGKYVTDITPQTALIRVSQMIDNPIKYGRKHEHN